ncbi:MAG: AAA family ATPase, partial [Thermodesulfobacteriota bacterium]|nr:AAA family ATPase [Thermodesulfobacteriota bacterium]
WISSGDKMPVEDKIEKQIQDLLKNTIILDRKYLDDEQLDREQQLQVLKEIFNVNVRDREIRELSSHFAPVFRQDHPLHLSMLGKTGTGKTVTMLYFLNRLTLLCRKKKIEIRHVHLDLSTPKPCFRVLNDLACFLDAAKRYKKGISLDELMGRIEEKMTGYRGYFVLFVDEVDHVRRDLDSFLKFLVRRLPQAIEGKLVLVFSSNKLNWQENIDPRIKSFLKVNEILFEPYNALDLRKIISIRIKKALNRKMIQKGVMEKIAAVSSRTHGDARKAVELLSKSAHIAEKDGTRITIDLVDRALEEIEKDKYVAMIKSGPKQLQAALYAIISAAGRTNRPLHTGDAYEAYRSFCAKVKLRALTQRAFSDLVSELDMYGFVQVRVLSRGRYGRTKEIMVNLSEELSHKLRQVVLMEFDLAPVLKRLT